MCNSLRNYKSKGPESIVIVIFLRYFWSTAAPCSTILVLLAKYLRINVSCQTWEADWGIHPYHVLLFTYLT